MPYTMEDFRRDFILDHLHEVPAREIVKRLPPEEILKSLTTEEILNWLLSKERLKNLPPEELSKLLTVEGSQAYLKKLLERSDADTK